jgi:hypothetical protein
MLYDQSPQLERSSRITVLNKVEDKYGFSNKSYPVLLEDIQQLEEDNKITINVFCMNGDTQIISRQDGNVLQCRNGMMNLLLMQEGEQAHYIYIKKIERVMRTCGYTGYKDRRYCPYCRQGISCKNETFEEHMMTKHLSTKSNCNLELPEEGATMKLNNYKDMLTRPFITYYDFEASLVKTQRKDGKTHKHIPNSAALHFVCTFDETRNEDYRLNGPDCVEQLVLKLQELFKLCIEEMRDNQEMILSSEDKLISRTLGSATSAMKTLQKRTTR